MKSLILLTTLLLTIIAFGTETYSDSVQSETTISPMYAKPISGGDYYYFDIPWRLEPSIKNLSILTMIYEERDLNAIIIYDANNNSNTIAYKNWIPSIKISPKEHPFIYSFSVPIQNLVQINGQISLKAKFVLNLYPDDNEGPLNATIGNDSLPSFTNWYYGDTHYHTYYSDNTWEIGAPVEASINAAKSIGLKWITLTDHSFDLNTTKWEIRNNACLDSSNANFSCIPAEEVTCLWPSEIAIPYSHYLAYNFSDFIPGEEYEDGCIPGMCNNYYCNELVDLVKNKGGIGYVAHPEDTDNLFRRKWQNYSLPFHGLEIWNQEKDIPQLESGIDVWKNLLRSGRKTFIEAGSDAHGDFNIDEQGDIGTGMAKVRTACFAKNFTKDNIFTALKNGNCMMTDGPIIVFTANKYILGESFDISEGDITTLNISWNSTNEFGNVTTIAVIRGEIGGNETKELILTPNDLSGSFVITSTPNNTYYRIEANSTDPDGIVHRAYTNPIWVYAEPRPEIEKIPMDETEHALVTAFEEKYDYSLKDLFFDGWPVAADCQTESLRENLGLGAPWQVIKCEKMFLNGSRLMWAGFNNTDTGEKKIMLQIGNLLQFADATYNPFAQDWTDYYWAPGYRNNNWIAYKNGKEIFEINEIYNVDSPFVFPAGPTYFGTYLIHGFRQYEGNTTVYYSHWGPDSIGSVYVHNIYVKFDDLIIRPFVYEGFSNGGSANFRRGILQRKTYNYSASNFKLGADGDVIKTYSQSVTVIVSKSFDSDNRTIFPLSQNSSKIRRCHADIDCNDGNLLTKDTCINKGTVNSRCNYIPQEPKEIKKPYTEMDADDISKAIDFRKKYNKTIGELYFDGWQNTTCNNAGILDMLKLDANWNVIQCRKFLINNTKAMFAGLNNTVTGKQYVAYQLGNQLVDEKAVYSLYSEDVQIAFPTFRYFIYNWAGIRNNTERFEVKSIYVSPCRFSYGEIPWCGSSYYYATYIFHGFTIDGNRNTVALYSYNSNSKDFNNYVLFLHILFDNYKDFTFEDKSLSDDGKIYQTKLFDYRAIGGWSIGTRYFNYQLNNRTLFHPYRSNDMLVELGSPAHISVSDSEGRITGYINGTYLSEIPGSEILDTEHERYRLPSGENYKIAVRGYQDGNYSLKMVFSSGGMLYFRNISASDRTNDIFELKNGTNSLAIKTDDLGKRIYLEAQNISDGLATINFTVSQNMPAVIFIPDWNNISMESIIREENTPPEILGTSPENNSIFESGQTIFIGVNATDADNDTLHYFIFFDRALISNSSEITYALNESGNHTITFNVSDGTDSTSSEISISVISPPVVNILSPENRTYNRNALLLDAALGGDINTAWISIDENPGQKYIAGASILSFYLDILPDGHHNITIYANNTLGRMNYSTVQFTIDTIPPNITIIFPEEKTYLNSDNITLDFGATDALSEISSITAVLDNVSVDKGQVIALRTLSLGNHTLIVNATDAAGNSAIESATFTIKPISATVDINPDTLNRKSKSGKNAVTAYIEVPGYDVNAIDVDSVTLSTPQGSISAQLTPTEIGDYDNDGVPDRIVKFDRQEVMTIIGGGGDTKLKLTGKISDITFEGADEIRVIQ